MSGVRRSTDKAAKVRTVQEHLDHRLVVSICRFQPISEAAYACSLESCLLSSRPPSHFLAALITQIRHSELLVYRRDVKV